MSFVCLLLSGAALLVNGLALLGRVPARDSGAFSGVIGILQLVIAVIIASTAQGNTAAVWGASGIVLFGLTYLYLSIDTARGLGGVSLGWFCGLVAVLGLVFAGRAVESDPLSAVLWLSWAAIWALFFALLALGRSSLGRLIGWSLLFVGVPGTVIPALLGLAGAWPGGALPAVAAGAVVVAGFTAAAVLAGNARLATSADTDLSAAVAP